VGGSGPEDNHAVTTPVPLEDRRRFLRLLHRELDLGGFFDAADRTLAGLIVEAYGLSRREREVTRLVLQGRSTAEMAHELHLSAHTVQDHLKAIFAKVGPDGWFVDGGQVGSSAETSLEDTISEHHT
jgi:DNA-binding CsgD family transcriptional regulator